MSKEVKVLKQTLKTLNETFDALLSSMSPTKILIFREAISNLKQIIFILEEEGPNSLQDNFTPDYFEKSEF